MERGPDPSQAPARPLLGLGLPALLQASCITVAQLPVTKHNAYCARMHAIEFQSQADPGGGGSLSPRVG